MMLIGSGLLLAVLGLGAGEFGLHVYSMEGPMLLTLMVLATIFAIEVTWLARC
jgi:hypothetical protein